MSERMPRVINNGIVLIQHEKIEKVLDGDRESFVSNGYRIVDAGGGFVLPGFIEAHCHMGITEEKKGMEGDDCNETVNPITPSLRALDAINPMDDAFHRAIEAGKLANITIFNGHPFDIFSKNLCTFICGEIVYKDSGFFI